MTNFVIKKASDNKTTLGTYNEQRPFEFATVWLQIQQNAFVIVVENTFVHYNA